MATRDPDGIGCGTVLMVLATAILVVVILFQLLDLMEAQK